MDEQTARLCRLVWRLLGLEGVEMDEQTARFCRLVWRLFGLEGVGVGLYLSEVKNGKGTLLLSPGIVERNYFFVRNPWAAGGLLDL